MKKNTPIPAKKVFNVATGGRIPLIREKKALNANASPAEKAMYHAKRGM